MSDFLEIGWPTRYDSANRGAKRGGPIPEQFLQNIYAAFNHQVYNETKGGTPMPGKNHGRRSITIGGKVVWERIEKVLACNRERGEIEIYLWFGEVLHVLAHMTAERLNIPGLLHCCDSELGIDLLMYYDSDFDSNFGSDTYSTGAESLAITELDVGSSSRHANSSGLNQAESPCLETGSLPAKSDMGAGSSISNGMPGTRTTQYLNREDEDRENSQQNMSKQDVREKDQDDQDDDKSTSQHR